MLAKEHPEKVTPWAKLLHLTGVSLAGTKYLLSSKIFKAGSQIQEVVSGKAVPIPQVL